MLFSGGVIGFVLHHIYMIEKICEECLIKEAMLEIKTNVIDRLENKKCDTCEENKEANKILESKLEVILEEDTYDTKEGWLDFLQIN